MRINSRKILAALTSIIFIMGGCTKAPEIMETTPSESQSPLPVESEVISPKYGGELNLSMRLPKTLNPLLNEDITVDAILKLIFLPLSELNENEKPVPNSAFVQSIDFADDGMSAVVNLKSGKKWSDGLEITAADLAFTLKTLKEAPDNVIYKENVKNILTAEITGVHSVKINFMQHFSSMPYLLCFPIIPEHYYKDVKDAETKNMNPVGNGPYVFSGYLPVDKLELAASDKSLTVKPYIDKINVKITSDVETDFNAFDQGMVNVVSGNVSDWGKYLASKDYHVTEYVSTYYDFIGFNFKRDIFQDKLVREAVAYSTPYEQILNDVYVNYAVRTASPISPKSWLYEEDVKTREFDIETAKQTLANAGWAIDSETGILSKELSELDIISKKLELKFDILVNIENEERVKIAHILKENLNSIGFSVDVVSVGFDEYQKRLIERDYDMFVGGYDLSIIPDFSFMLNSLNAGLGTNYFDYKDAAMDILLIKANEAVGDSGYKKAMSELQKYIAEELPCISLVFRKSAVIMDRNVFGEIKPSLNNLYININEWFIK